MYSTPRKNGDSNTYNTPKKVPLKGLFQDGVWHCNCKPRLPAAHFLVRKDGPNKGRWFYTCQEPKESSCGFFLWNDDAVGREMRAVINNSRSEPAAGLETGVTKDADILDRRTIEGHVEASNKWMADLRKKEEEEFGDWPLLVNDERSLVNPVENQARPLIQRPYPETPRKAAKLDIMATPGSNRKRDEAEAWPTPTTGGTNSDDVFTTWSTTRPEGSIQNRNGRLDLMSPLVTPVPTRFREGNQPFGAGEATLDPRDYDITAEVMEILKDQSLDEDTSAKLREVLNKYALKSHGIARGRDITRNALKLKDAKIVELEQRVMVLETEGKMGRGT